MNDVMAAAALFVNLDVWISWLAEGFVKLVMQILWQGQHFANLKVVDGLTSCKSRSMAVPPAKRKSAWD